MRALLERSYLTRAAKAVAGAAAVLALIHAAEAHGDFGLRRATLVPDEPFTAVVRIVPAVSSVRKMAAPPRRRPRRIWAAARNRPLGLALARTHGRGLRAGAPERMAARGTAKTPRVARFRLAPPRRPAVVSIYEDRTLRNGDAVMLADGVHVFRGDGAWPHRPRDFVRLQFAASLDWHLRQTLDSLDNNPPTRWSSIMEPPA